MKLLEAISMIWRSFQLLLHLTCPWNLLERKTSTRKLDGSMHGKPYRCCSFRHWRPVKICNCPGTLGGSLLNSSDSYPKNCRLQLIENVSGIWPLMLFPPRFNTARCSTFSTKQGGMLPLNLLADKSRTSSRVAVQKDVGIAPLRLLFERDK